MKMESVKDAHQHALHAMEEMQMIASLALMAFTCHKQLVIVLNVQMDAMFATKMENAQNATIISTRIQTDIAFNAISHAENAKETQTTASLVDLVITSMEKSASRAIQTAKNAMVHETCAPNVVMVNTSTKGNFVNLVHTTVKFAQVRLMQNANNALMVTH